MFRNLNIEIKDTVFVDEDERTTGDLEVQKQVFYKEKNNDTLYKVRIFLEGEDLLYVKSVTYMLPTSFSKKRSKILRTQSNPNCELVIWTWGLFEIKAKVIDKFGDETLLKHYLKYDLELIRNKGKMKLLKM